MKGGHETKRAGDGRRLVVLVSASLVVSIAIVAACSSDDTPGAGSSGNGSTSSSTSSSSGASGGDGGVGPDGRAPRDPNANCVKPGTPNNDQGIGGYCETQADCVKGKSTCTGALGAPDNAWFCTRLCNSDPNCGDGLYCAHDPRGIVCVPIVCGYTDADAPRDAEPDSD